jgi:hypothetical protein
LGFLPRRDPRTAPPIRPAAPVASPATTTAFEPPPFCCWDEEEPLAPLLLALVPERALLFDALLLFAPLPLFEAVERRAELAVEPLEPCDVFFCALGEPVFG